MSTPGQASEFYGAVSDALHERGEMQGDGIYLTIDYQFDGQERAITIDSAMTGMTHEGAHAAQMGATTEQKEAAHRRLLADKLGWLTLLERDANGYALPKGARFTAMLPSTVAYGYADAIVGRLPSESLPDDPVIYDHNDALIVAEPLQHPVLSAIYRKIIATG